MCPDLWGSCGGRSHILHDQYFFYLYNGGHFVYGSVTMVVFGFGRDVVTSVILSSTDLLLNNLFLGAYFRRGAFGRGVTLVGFFNGNFSYQYWVRVTIVVGRGGTTISRGEGDVTCTQL